MKRSIGALVFQLFVLFSFAQSALGSSNGSLPEPLQAAGAAYKQKGPGAFLPTLLKGSQLPDVDKTSFHQARIMLQEIENYYGSYTGLELVDSIPVSGSTRLVYFILNYERGPLYGVAVVYATDRGEIVTSSNLNTELQQIIPAGIIPALK